MKKQAAALALSLVLCCGSFMPSLALAATSRGPAPKAPQAPSVVKTAITQNHTHVELTMGKAHVIKLSMPATRVSISDPEAVGLVMLSPTEIQLIGKSIGVANLLVWSENTRDNYLTVDLSVHRDVSALAGKIRMIDPGINIVPVAAEDSVILTGVAESMDKAQLAYDLTRAFFQEDDKAGTQTGEVSSNSPGSASIFGNSTKIINLIRVIGQPSTKAEMVQERLKDIDPNISLKVVPGFGGKEKAILSGKVRNASMVSKAINLASVFYGTPGIKLLTGPGGNVIKEGKEQDAGGGFEAGSGGGLIGNLAGNILHGSIITDTSGNVVSMLEVEERPQVKCTIKFLEVTKTKNFFWDSQTLIQDQGNVSLLSQITSQVAGSPFTSLRITAGNTFDTILTSMVTKGNARILAEPTITSISGEPASFLAGGEFPIPVIGTNGGVSVIFKEFGIRLDLLATVTDRGTIHMQVSPEVSSLDQAGGVTINGTTIPGLRSRRGQTVLEMKNGESFVLGGLYNENMNDTLRRTPILGQIPILGLLFSSRDYQSNKTEMVIVIQPKIDDGMNISNLNGSNSSHVSQTIKLSPEEVFKQLSEAGNKDTKGKTVTWDATKMQPSDATKPAEGRASMLTTPEGSDKKTDKKALKEIKREQARMERESRKLEKAQKPSNNLAPVPPAMVTTAPVPAPTENYMSTQQSELADILRNLEGGGTASTPSGVPQSPLKSVEPGLPTQAVKPEHGLQ